VAAKEYDVERAMTGGHLNADEFDDKPGLESLRTLQRAVVVDALDDLAIRDDAFIDKMIAVYEVSAEIVEAWTDAPRNSLVGRLCSNGKGRAEKDLQLFYPFFSSHMCLPCKAGEQVWVIFEDPTAKDGQGYWLSRIMSPVDVEDANYTHYDRNSSPTDPEAAKAFLGKDDAPIESPNPGFPNGPVYVLPNYNQYTLAEEDAFEKITTENPELNNFVVEPIPRYTKRPGDFVLQGSHNTTLVLGTGRGYKDTDTIDTTKSNAQLAEPLTPGNGAIDLVVGRGRINVDIKTLAGEGEIDSAWPLAPDGDKLVKPPGVTPTKTEPQVIMNARKTFEVDKNVSLLDATLSNAKSNASEGDPDFVNDAARLYLTMKSNPDEDFALVADKMPALFEGELAPAADRACSVLKADEVRIIARKIGPDSPTEPAQPTDDGKNKPEPYVGSIRLVKEGGKTTDASSIYMLPDGTIQISGAKIYLGRQPADEGKGGGPAEGESHPYVRYQELEDLWNALMDQITTFCDTVLTHTTPGYGAPSPQLNAAANALKTAVASPLKPDIAKVKSERIFGE